MTPRERIKKILNLRIPDQIARRDSYWNEEIIARWHQEGLPEEETPCEYFGIEEEWESVWIMPGLGLKEKVLRLNLVYLALTKNRRDKNDDQSRFCRNRGDCQPAFRTLI